MIEYILENGIKVCYVKRDGNISSFCIGFDAGALVEDKYELGLAHAVEHMLFKGTKTRNEYEINKICDEIFGFHNAMTNYPYAIYYGTTLSEDFRSGFEVYSDIILNPTFPKQGFKEEIDIILEELKEWKDDPYQECEDELLFNSFNKRRIKELIIGNSENIKKITLNDIERFYNTNYTPPNCVISVVSSMSFDKVLSVIEDCFGSWRGSYSFKKHNLYEDNNEGIFYKTKQDLNGAKIQYCFPIHFLSDDEIKLLKIFNFKFGEGTSSILYDNIRTKNGLAYDIGSVIKNESGIKLFTIRMGTSTENINKSIELINRNIDWAVTAKDVFKEESIKNIIKGIELKNELSVEKSIELCKKITTQKIMFDSTRDTFDEFSNYKDINESKILNVINKVLRKPSIQVLKPEE